VKALTNHSYVFADNNRIRARIRADQTMHDDYFNDFNIPEWQAKIVDSVHHGSFDDALRAAGLLTLGDLDHMPQIEVPDVACVEDIVAVKLGGDPRTAIRRFRWGLDSYYTVRPDFIYLCAKTNLCEPGLNDYEWTFREMLHEHHKFVSNLYGLIAKENISRPTTRDRIWWNEHLSLHGEIGNFDSTGLAAPGIQSDAPANDGPGKRKPGRPPRSDWPVCLALAAIIYFAERDGPEVSRGDGLARRVNGDRLATRFKEIVEAARYRPPDGHHPAPRRSSFEESLLGNIFEIVGKSSELYDLGCRKSPPRVR
jgi:hypothetical protein